jgi:hypothetical protein
MATLVGQRALRRDHCQSPVLISKLLTPGDIKDPRPELLSGYPWPGKLLYRAVWSLRTGSPEYMVIFFLNTCFHPVMVDRLVVG